MSWAHQRSRELADQILDDAQSFGQRVAAGADGLRRGGLVFVDTILDLPVACRERLTAIAHGIGRPASNAVAATLDAAWAVADAGRRLRRRRARVLAVATAPLVPALTVLIVLSARPGESTALRHLLATKADVARPVPQRPAPEHPLRESFAARRPAVVVAPEAAPRVHARASSGPATTRRASAPSTVSRVRDASPTPVRPTHKPPAPAAAKPRRAPKPAAPASPKPAPKHAPVAVPEAVPAAAQPDEVRPAAPVPTAATPPTAAERPIPPAVPAAPVVARDEDEDGDDDDGKRRKDKGGHHGDDDDDGHHGGSDDDGDDD